MLRDGRRWQHGAAAGSGKWRTAERARVSRVGKRGEKEGSASWEGGPLMDAGRGGAGREEGITATARHGARGRRSGFTVSNRKKPFCENPLGNI